MVTLSYIITNTYVLKIIILQREEAYLHFRWTRRTTRTAIIGGLIIPGIVYYYASKYQVCPVTIYRLEYSEPVSTQNKFQWTQRKGEPLIPSDARTASQ